ncbi:retinoid-inducible serine carboxypeptidase-like isoform X3 [Lycorma delicatula]|uniref:retinoid-inducible serine carboxypeptidase-like isoform X3 n=1 Tax=Lycorma delicatula TaxID=130591 RepID=UPI003F513B27
MYKTIYFILVFFCVSTLVVTGKKGFGPGSQEYGYVEVRKGAHMFYWLYYINTVKESEATKHPLVIWLQGGPGASSTGYGNFEEFGTLYKNLSERESAWEIKKHKLKINFKGIALGDSWISPVDSCLTWAPYLLNIGEIDMEGYNEINNVAQKLKSEVESGQWFQATDSWSDLESVVKMTSPGIDFYNILYGSDDDDAVLSNDLKDQNNNEKKLFLYKFSQGLKSIMDQVHDTFKSVIPSSVEWNSQSTYVFDYLREDFMKPVTNYVEKLLNETNLQVVVYSGQLDLIVDTPGTLNWVERLHWPGAEKWKKADRTSLKVESKQEGFVKTYDKFTFYWINRAGHMVPTDNPYGALEMLKQVTSYKK